MGLLSTLRERREGRLRDIAREEAHYAEAIRAQAISAEDVLKWLNAATDKVALATQISTFGEMVNKCYLQSADMQAAVGFIARAFQSLEWTSSDQDIADALNAASPTMAGTFWNIAIQHLYLSGACYIVPVMAGERIDSLALLDPGTVSVNKGTKLAEISGYTHKNGNGSEVKKYKPDELLYLWFPSPLDQVAPLSPFVASSAGIQIGIEGRKWNLGLMLSGAKVGGWLKHPNTLSPERLKEENDAINRATASAARRGGYVVVHGGAELHPEGLTPAEMDWSDGIRISILDACKVVGINPLCLQIDDAGTYQNTREAVRNTHAMTIVPLIRWVAGEIEQFFSFRRGRKVEVGYKPWSLPYAEVLRLDLYDKMNGVDYLTDNEKREQVGFEPVATGNVIWKQAGLIDYPAKLTPTKEAPRRELSISTRAIRPNPRTIRNEERSMRSSLAAYFANEGEHIARVAESASINSVDTAVYAAVDLQAEAWRLLYQELVTYTASIFARAAMKEATKAEGDLVWQTLIKDWIESEGAERVVGILDETKRQLKLVIDAGMQEGLSIPSIARNIRAQYDNMSKVRAVRIARTEVIAASNLGTISGARATGLAMKKFWIVSTDGRERDEHAQAGEDYSEDRAIPLDAMFEVGGESLDFPGDSSHGASAWNVIQCRCTAGYIPE